jgi:[DsrC]-trisulfide reductase subunit M
VDIVYYLVLVPMVYVAVAIFVVGIGVRLVKLFLEPRNPSTLQIFPERHPRWLWALGDAFLLPATRRFKPFFWVVLMLFHLAFLLLIIGHIELIAEIKPFQVIPHGVFLGGGFVGLLLCLAVLYFLFRRFVSPTKDLSVPEDYYLLILLFLTLLFGSQMDWARRWYGYDSISVADYREYLSSLLYLKPHVSASLTAAGHSFMLLLHIFFANLFLMFFPFSQLMHSVFSVPMNKLRRG